MKRFFVVAVIACLSGSGVVGGVSLAGPAGSALHRVNAAVCGSPSAGSARCAAVREDTYVNGKPRPAVMSWTRGYGSADLQAAYALTSASARKGLGATVAIVDAFDHPRAASDLAIYRRTMGLSSMTTCVISTTSIASVDPAKPCFAKVDQSGGTSLPREDAGWAQEISLDIEMASAICPNCNVLLVEAKSNTFHNLTAAVSYTSRLRGVVSISNSYGASDTRNMTAYETAATTYHKAVVASAGDAGYGVESPASFTHVIAVGGTHLVRDSSARGWRETGWSGAGSGCSVKNIGAWQSSNTTGCSRKATADVSAVADPKTGVAVYSSAFEALSGWYVFGGTSVAAPIVASVYALANDFGASAGQWTWTHAAALNDVTSGSNGVCATPKWCTARAGWDGPTGLGTPNGTAAF